MKRKQDNQRINYPFDDWHLDRRMDNVMERAKKWYFSYWEEEAKMPALIWRLNALRRGLDGWWLTIFDKRIQRDIEALDRQIEIERREKKIAHLLTVTVAIK